MREMKGRTMGLVRCTVVFGLVLASAVAAIGGTDMDLAGEWSFRLDPDDAGVGEQWFAKPLPDKIKLPGSLQEQGRGHDVSLQTVTIDSDPRYAPYRKPGNIKDPVWLQPEKHYVGAAWYQRAMQLPDAMLGKRLVLSLERCHWETTVWINGIKIGSQNSLSTPHEYDLTQALTPAPGSRTPHTLTIRVDNRIIVNVGSAHSVGNPSNWNGIVGGIRLHVTDRVWVDDVLVYPDVKTRSARVVVTIGNATKGAGSGTLRITATCTNTKRKHSPPPLEVPVRWEAGNGRAEFTYPLGDDAQPWDEFSPALYRMDVQLSAREKESSFRDARAVIFGLRNIATEGTQFVLNGHKVFLRGTLECGTFPKTGYPATDVDSWKRIISICKAHGLNHMRFHSWCPPEAAFTAADELGFYFQVEAACWAHIGDGKPIDGWIYEESDRILRAYGNHPSFVLMAHGNEPRGRERGALFLEPWVKHFRQKDPRRLYAGGSGWPSVKGADYHVTFWKFRMHGGQFNWKGFNSNPPETTRDHRGRVGIYDVPTISHEPGQWCAFPNLAEIPKYTGLLKARNFEIVRDFLQEKGMLPQAHDFLMASGKAQALLYKQEIEAFLRTPGVGGFQLLGLNDYPASALVGVLDLFWDSKGYVTAEEHRRYCGPVVPLARMAKRVWLQGETFAAEVEVCQFGPDDLKDATVRWALLDRTAREVASGQWPKCDLLQGGLRPVGKIESPLTTLETPAKLTLRVWVQDTPWQNSWDLWVYPPRTDTTVPESVRVAETLDEPTVAHLQSGGRVLLLPSPGAIKGNTHGSFASVFWSKAPGGAGFSQLSTHTLGILCDPKHAALAAFPTDSHQNWQWWDLMLRGKPVVMDNLPRGLSPIVQVIDDCNTCRKLGLVFEARVGKGRLLMCAIDLQQDLDKRPVARQMRHSLLQYAAGDAFAPQVEVSVDALRALLK